MYMHKIDTIDDIKSFFDYLLDAEELSFHPDEDFSSYISVKTTEPTFSKFEVKHYNSLMARAFDVCQKTNVDIYELAMNCLKSYMAKD